MSDQFTESFGESVEDVFSEGHQSAEIEQNEDQHPTDVEDMASKPSIATQTSQHALATQTSEQAPAADEAGDSSPSVNGDVPKTPTELTQSYLRLLNTGRLASKKKHDSGMSMRAKLKSGEAGDSMGEAQLRSVWEAELARLRNSTRAMDMPPLRGCPGSGGSSGSDRRSSQSRAEGGRVSPRSPQPRTSSQAREPGGASTRSSSGNPFHKLYTPGPGAYSPNTTRYGSRDAASIGFGTARQRPPHVCIQDNIASPGPIYKPNKEVVSSLTAPIHYSFGRQYPGSRYEPGAELAPNHPHWNPGPGEYEPKTLASGKLRQPGADAPKPVFGSSNKMVSPQSNFSATVFLSQKHAMRENVGVHSPGPAAYSPDTSPTRVAAAEYSLGKKAASYFDLYLDPQRQLSPGPMYTPKVKTWGNDPRATFGKAPSRWEPEANLSATPFISKQHAYLNHGVHSPGPGVYSPETSKPQHVPTPALSSGQQDRFYDRFEPGRIL